MLSWAQDELLLKPDEVTAKLLIRSSEVPTAWWEHYYRSSHHAGHFLGCHWQSHEGGEAPCALPLQLIVIMVLGYEEKRGELWESVCTTLNCVGVTTTQIKSRYNLSPNLHLLAMCKSSRIWVNLFCLSVCRGNGWRFYFIWETEKEGGSECKGQGVREGGKERERESERAYQLLLPQMPWIARTGLGVGKYVWRSNLDLPRRLQARSDWTLSFPQDLQK